MTIEEKQKRYNKALEKAKEVKETYLNLGNISAAIVLESIFPELKESVGERVKKVIKQILNESTTEKDKCYLDNRVTQQEVFAWLEKQGEPVVYDRDNYDSAKEKAWNCKSLNDDSNCKSVFMEGFQDGYQFGIHEEKPHRWTRHDEAVREEAVACLVDWKNKFPSIDSEDYRNVLHWLKDELTINAEEKQGEQKEILCDKCRREQPSHSCQDITELGRCAIEHQSKQKPIYNQDNVRGEAYNFLTKEVSDTQNGPMVHVTIVEEAIKAVSNDEELREKALDFIYECETVFDWIQLDDAKYIIDIALGIED